MTDIVLQDVVKRHGVATILPGLSLAIGAGEFLTLVGPSGCGKSTLLRLIAGLDDPDGGRIAIGGRDMAGARPKDRDVAMVFQGYALYPHLSVFDNMALPLRVRRLSSWQRLPLIGPLVPGRRAVEASIRGEVEDTAASLDIAGLLGRKPGQLSGGQRQRVALGRAMVRHPAVFLMDEPLSNLDAKLRHQMRGEIAALHRRLGVTFVLVTHDQAEAMTMSDRVAVMMEGRLIQVGPPGVLYHDPQDLRVAEFIGSPKINVLEPAAFQPPRNDGIAQRLAFRPEAAALVAPGEGSLTGVVTAVENLGADLFVHVEVAAGTGPVPVVVRTDPMGPRLALGEAVGIAPDPARILRFDAAGLRLPSRCQVAA